MKPSSKNVASRIVFVSGPPRSGTTWLQREVCLAIGAAFLPECTLLTQQIELYGRTLRYCDEKRFKATFLDAEHLKRYYQDNVTRLVTTLASSNSLRSNCTLVLKDPSLALYLDDLKALFPRSKTLLIMRDPRDVLASMKTVTARKATAWDIKTTISEVFAYYHGIANYMTCLDKRCLVLRYEDLVTVGLEPVEHFLASMKKHKTDRQQIHSEMNKNRDETDPFRSEYSYEPTTSERIGSYKAILERAELIEVEGAFSGVILQWGY